METGRTGTKKRSAAEEGFRSRLGSVSRLLVALTLCVILTGGHWAVLQSSAWAKMVWNYSQDMSLFAAVEKTFGGLPCDFCKKVRDAWEKEEGKTSDKVLDQFVKVECLVPESEIVVRLDFRLFVYPADVAERFHARVLAPPVPVPIVC